MNSSETLPRHAAFTEATMGAPHYQRTLALESLEPRQMLAADVAVFQNPLMYHDVNNDEHVTSIDALNVINRLNGHGAETRIARFLDVNGDENLSAIDALQVVNGLNGLPREGHAVFEHVQHVSKRLKAARGRLPIDLAQLGERVLGKMDVFSDRLKEMRTEIREFLNQPDGDAADLRQRFRDIKDRIAERVKSLKDELTLVNPDTDQEVAVLEEGEVDNRVIPFPRRLREAIETGDLPESIDLDQATEVLDAVEKRQWRPFRTEGFRRRRPQMSEEARQARVDRIRSWIDSGNLPEFISAERAHKLLNVLTQTRAEGESHELLPLAPVTPHDQFFADLGNEPA